MLKYRLVFGTIMIFMLVGLLLFGSWLDGSISENLTDKPIQGSVLMILMVLIAVPAHLELASLVKPLQVKTFVIINIICTILLSASWYIQQFYNEPGKYQFLTVYICFCLVTAFFALGFKQGYQFACENAVTNIAVNYFLIIYLGFLSSFLIAMRVEFGIWPVLMFIFVVKSADIGAYTIGKTFGKRPFSPRISPKKTWEGMTGAVIFAIIVSVIFGWVCGIMPLLWSAVFGFCFAFLGQMGDLLESIIKRDAGAKDSASSVPGFGGVLDVIDSPLATAPIAYAFMAMILMKG
jgi:phosphatidate cytidylyltransferase